MPQSPQQDRIRTGPAGGFMGPATRAHVLENSRATNIHAPKPAVWVPPGAILKEMASVNHDEVVAAIPSSNSWCPTRPTHTTAVA
jgi:hypothetical protein